MARTATHSPVRLVVYLASSLGMFAFASQPSPAHAQTPYDAVAVAPTIVARVGITMNITAGPSGAPGGFSVCWMTLADFIANGSAGHGDGQVSLRNSADRAEIQGSGAGEYFGDGVAVASNKAIQRAYWAGEGGQSHD